MTLDKAILATLAYHDIFDYPLKKEEIASLLVGKKTSAKAVSVKIKHLENLRKIKQKGEFFFLKGRENLYNIRRVRQKYSNGKLKRAILYSKLLTPIPTIKLVAVSGALAMGNSHKSDDIDLVIITQKNTIWTTRFLANLILFPFKRKPPQLPTTNYKRQTNNKACLNLFLDESDLKIRDQNLYTAHEIAQMKPLMDRGETYSRFIKANQWILKYLPNWQTILSPVISVPPSVIPAKLVLGPDRGAGIQLHLSILEKFLKKFQLTYMKPRITTERIGEHQLFFHPQDTREWVLAEYQKRLKKLKILPLLSKT
ncbi:hypothetical protein HYZ70_03255 [Candidatus Curtissbacteria bacterium]|nr:hypothetical protein [Candidatus Curtissbacteria bacterium]